MPWNKQIAQWATNLSNNMLPPMEDVDLSFLDTNQAAINKKLSFQNSRLGSLLSGAVNIATGVMGGPMGWIGLGVKTLGDNIGAARSQFDMQGFQDTLNNARADYIGEASDARNTSDLLNLAENQPDFTGTINSQDYEWNGNPLTGIGALIGKGKTKRDQRKALAMQENMQNQLAENLVNAGNQVSNISYRQGMANFLNNAAMGGQLSTHGSDFSDGLTRIDTGGSHESNPLGGVPAGVDPQGIPNLVEEGETIWDDYVFSDRLKAPKPLVKKLGLGGGKKGLTYAEASKKITEKSGANLRPNDPISKRTEEAQLAELEESQEEKRMKLEKKKLIDAISQMNPDELQGLFAPQPVASQPVEMQAPPQGGMEEPVSGEPIGFEPENLQGFALGGNLFKKGGRKSIAQQWEEAIQSGTVKPQKDDPNYWSGYVNGRKVAGVSARQVQAYRAKAAYDNGLSQPNPIQQVQQTSNPAQAQKEVIPTPLNEAVKVYYRNQPQITMEEADLQESLPTYEGPTFNTRVQPNLRGLQTIGNKAVSVQLENPFYSYLVPEGTAETATVPTPITQSKPKATGQKRSAMAPLPTVPDLGDVIIDSDDADILRDITQENAKFSASMKDTPIVVTKAQSPANTPELKDLPTWMRYAPIVGGGLSVLGNAFSSPNYQDYDDLIATSRRLSRPVNIPVVTIGDRIRRNPFDERLAINQANQNFLAGIRSTLDNAGGNRAYRQFANNLMAYNNQGALSEIGRNAYLANRQDALQTADFNRGTAIQNMNAINQRNLTQAQLNSNREQAGLSGLAHATQLKDTARRYDDQFVDADFTGFLQSLGNLGRENEQRNWLTSLAREGILNYAFGPRGSIGFVPGVTTAKCGGKIKTKKRRF